MTVLRCSIHVLLGCRSLRLVRLPARFASRCVACGQRRPCCHYLPLVWDMRAANLPDVNGGNGGQIWWEMNSTWRDTQPGGLVRRWHHDNQNTLQVSTALQGNAMQHRCNTELHSLHRNLHEFSFARIFRLFERTPRPKAWENVKNVNDSLYHGHPNAQSPGRRSSSHHCVANARQPLLGRLCWRRPIAATRLASTLFASFYFQCDYITLVISWYFGMQNCSRCLQAGECLRNTQKRSEKCECIFTEICDGLPRACMILVKWCKVDLLSLSMSDPRTSSHCPFVSSAFWFLDVCAVSPEAFVLQADKSKSGFHRNRPQTQAPIIKVSLPLIWDQVRGTLCWIKKF